mgnify:CR=1 FL=1
MALILNRDDSQNIVFKAHEDFKTIEDTIVATLGYCLIRCLIVKHKPTGKYYKAKYREAYLEDWTELPFAHDPTVEWKEVVPREVLKPIYVEVEI